jgi:FKBP-type peptidyl-prolyl cis-trans isomerase
MKTEAHIRSAPRTSRWPFRTCGMAARVAACAAVVCGIALPAAHAQQGGGTMQAKANLSVPPVVLSPPPDVAAPSAYTAEKSASGVFMKVLTSGNGVEHPVENDCVRVRFTGWKRDGSLFSTSGIHGESRIQCINSAMPGMVEALETMVAGEKLRVWVPASLTFGKKHHHGHSRMDLDDEPPPNLDLTFEVELLEVIKAPPVPANLKTPSNDAVKTSSGLAFQVLKNGTGTQHPSMTSQVTLHYSGWTNDGKLFETTVMSGHPAIFLVATMLPAWREVLPHMVVGEKVRLWVPASLAYGEKPVNNMNPAGDLVYDIELLASQ